MFAILRAAGPELLPPGPFVDEQGISHPDNATALWSLAELAAVGVLPVALDPVPTGMIVTGFHLALAASGDRVRQSWDLQPEPPLDLRRYAKAKRDGLLSTQVVVVNGMPFPTDERTTDFIAKANTAARGNPGFSIPKWRLPDNTYVALDNPTIIKVGDTFLNYVGALFVANAGLDDGISAGTVTTPAQVDAAYSQVVASFGG